MTIEIILFTAAIIASAIASVAGFGIGSILTPVLSLALGPKLAIAIIAIPHLVATGLRFFMLRSHVDKKLLWSFGITSAVGGLLGALLHGQVATLEIGFAFAAILLFAGFTGVTGISERMRFRGAQSWVAGGISGFLGGLVGNQGGIRAAALLGANISAASFVATATAIGLIVDFARMPVYFWYQSSEILGSAKWILISTVGVIIGTLLGTKLLKGMPIKTFKRTVSGLIFALGLYMLYQTMQAA